MNLAPIAISTYVRQDHLRQTIDALRENEHAESSDLYIFSDGPRPGDEQGVATVREYIKSISGFRSLTPVFRETNNRVFNFRNGLENLLAEHGRVIYLEEDIVTDPSFLGFINSGLDVYEDRDDVFAICGYTPPVDIGRFYPHDVFLCPRFSSWGYGIWKKNYDRIISDKKKFFGLLNDRDMANRFRRNGEDLIGMLRQEAEGAIDALDVKIFYTLFEYGQSVICPTRSLTNNIGHDGTGVHCGTTQRFQTDLSNQRREWVFDPDIQSDPRINRALYRFRSNLPQSFLRRMFRQFIIRPGKRLSRVFKPNSKIKAGEFTASENPL